MSIYEEAFKKTKKKSLQGASDARQEGERGTGLSTGATDEGGDSPSSEPVEAALQTSDDKSKGAAVYPQALRTMREHLDGIWGNIVLQNPERPRSLLFCGGTHGEGVTFVSFHLSLFLALEYSMKVLYVDTGVDKMQKGDTIYDVPDHPGLVSYLTGARTLESLVARTDYENLFVIPAGAPESQGLTSGIIARRESLERLSHFCREYFDLVVYDGLPASMYPSVFGFARVVDQVILVCRYAFSRREVLKLVADKMSENGTAVSGIILNDRQYPVPAKVYRYIR